MLFCQVQLKLAQWFYRRRFLIFHYFVIFFLWKTVWSFIWLNLYILLPRMLCNKFGWNLRTNVFLLFRNYLPLEKGRALHLSKLEFPSVKDDFCQVWLILAQWICRRRFFKFVNVFLLFHNYLSLEKGGALHVNKLESPTPKDTMCQV
mgnify:CR=1 FL=1